MELEEMETCTEGDTVSKSPSPPPPPLPPFTDENTSVITSLSPPLPHNHHQDSTGTDATTASAMTTRTADQVALSAKAAGLTNTTGPVQLLHFSAQLNSDEIKLLEVPSNVLQALKQGDNVVIRGDPSEDAVLCTDDKTFELRIADTSNALLITPTLILPKDAEFQNHESNSLISKEVTACLNAYLELRPCRPRIEKLKQLLSEYLYRGPEAEIEFDPLRVADAEESATKRRKGPQKYTFDDLLDCIQASEMELWQALERLQACLIQGYWRLLDLDYRDQVFQRVLTLLEEEDWSYRCVPLNAACQKLEELEPGFVIEHCLKCYGDRLDDDDNNPSDRAGSLGMRLVNQDSEVYYELSEDKVCQFYAELLLRPAGKFNFDEFMESWQQSVPDGMTTSLEQLKGLALTDMKSMPPVIWHFPVLELPQDPAERFDKLFATREKWTRDELEPFIQDLETPTQSLNALLLKHARTSTSARGEKTYNTKRTVHS